MVLVSWMVDERPVWRVRAVYERHREYADPREQRHEVTRLEGALRATGVVKGPTVSPNRVRISVVVDLKARDETEALDDGCG